MTFVRIAALLVLSTVAMNVDYVPITDEYFEVDITPPPKDIEDEGTDIDLTSIRDDVNNDVLKLNRYTFDGNVKLGDTVDNWIVFFCVDWYAPCQLMWPQFKILAAEWQEKLDHGDPLRSKVRFASVDCTVDKVLCNAQDANGYPWVKHYNAETSSVLPFKARTLEKAVDQVRSWLAMKLLEKPKVVLDEEQQESQDNYDPWSLSTYARFAGVRHVHSDLVDIGLLLSACAAAAGLYVTRGGSTGGSTVHGSEIEVPTKVVSAATPSETVTYRPAASLLPKEWCTDRKEITL